MPLSAAGEATTSGAGAVMAMVVLASSMSIFSVASAFMP